MMKKAKSPSDASRRRPRQRTAQEFLKELSLDEMVRRHVPVYQKLDENRCRRDGGVLSSPTGQKLLREQPAMAGESMQAVAARVQKALDLANDHGRTESAGRRRQGKTPPAEKPEQHKN